MKKKDLIQKLEESIRWEDQFILQYDNPSFWTLIEGSFSKDIFVQVKKLFSMNIKDTRIHGRMLRKLIRQIERIDKDEY
jgi:hypothetical protein